MYLTNKWQFSMVSALVDHKNNDIIKCSKLKWNVPLPGFEHFMASSYGL